MRKKRILFLFPGGGGIPIGGYKVVYEYANRLVTNDYEVEVVYPAHCFQFNQSFLHIVMQYFKAILRLFYNGVFKRYSCRAWFNLDKRIKERWVWSLDEFLVGKADVYIATAVQTAVYLNKYRKIAKGNKYYFIQHYENWGGTTNKDVEDTYRFEMTKIVIARWLKRIVNNLGEKCILIPNGFDFAYFALNNSILTRNKYTVCMLYHNLDWKGCSDGFRALDIVKEKYPQLQVNIFGVPSRPVELPDWYHYFQKPNREEHNRLYNESAIFIGTSWSEGWGLTVGEAMICGCAVACTDNMGYMEMAEDNVTALLSPVKDIEYLAANIIRLIEDDDLRYRIASAGSQNIQQYNWESSYRKFVEVINKNE